MLYVGLCILYTRVVWEQNEWLMIFLEAGKLNK